MYTKMERKSKYEDFINGIGALAETLSLFYNNLMNRGFDKEQAFKLTQNFLLVTLSGSKKENNSEPETT